MENQVIDAAIARAARRLASWRRVLIASHRDPDGDALGASLGLALALQAGGLEITVVNADPPIERSARATTDASERTGLAAIPGVELIVPWDKVEGREFDGMVMVDCSTLDRLHLDPEIPRRVLERSGDLIVIDHHVSPSQRSDGDLGSVQAERSIRIVDPSRASSAELIALLIEAAELPMGAEVATALLTGIATDTKGFLREDTDARALASASRLRAQGGAVSVAEGILQRHSAGFLILAGDVLSRAVIMEDGAGILATIPQELLESSRVHDGEVELLIALLIGTREARVIAVLQDQADEVRGSIRTREPIEAVAIARHFGGGGHARRSGFRVPQARMDDVLAELSDLVQRAINNSGRGYFTE